MGGVRKIGIETSQKHCRTLSSLLLYVQTGRYGYFVVRSGGTRCFPVPPSVSENHLSKWSNSYFLLSYACILPLIDILQIISAFVIHELYLYILIDPQHQCKVSPLSGTPFSRLLLLTPPPPPPPPEPAVTRLATHESMLSAPNFTRTSPPSSLSRASRTRPTLLSTPHRPQDNPQHAARLIFSRTPYTERLNKLDNKSRPRIAARGSALAWPCVARERERERERERGVREREKEVERERRPGNLRHAVSSTTPLSFPMPPMSHQPTQGVHPSTV